MARAPKVTDAVRQVLESYPESIRERLLAVRSLVFETAARTDGVGELTETLKWGEPAYLTKSSGTTIRLGWKPKQPKQFAMYVNCQTTLIETFRELAPEGVSFEGNRAMVFAPPFDAPRDFIVACIAAALTYHQKASVR